MNRILSRKRSWAIAAGMVSILCQPSLGQHGRSIPLLVSGSIDTQLGFVRLINRSSAAGDVTVIAIDDSGREFGPVRLTVEGGATVTLDARDFEAGNREIGIARGIGAGRGNWRLLLSSQLNVQASSNVRAADGFVTGTSDLARRTVVDRRHAGYDVPTFNPAGDRNPGSLRRINTSDRRREASNRGVDDRGAAAPGRDVRVSYEMVGNREFGWWMASASMDRQLDYSKPGYFLPGDTQRGVP